MKKLNDNAVNKYSPPVYSFIIKKLILRLNEKRNYNIIVIDSKRF